MLSRETQGFMEAAVDAVIVINHLGAIQAVNDSVRRMFGYRSDELLGENVSMLMPEPDRENHNRYMAGDLQSGVAKGIGLEPAPAINWVALDWLSHSCLP